MSFRRYAALAIASCLFVWPVSIAQGVTTDLTVSEIAKADDGSIIRVPVEKVSAGAALGSLVFFPHAITNNGNTDDIFDLATVATGGADDFPLTAIEIFPDADQDGVPDSLTPITVTPAILAGDSFGIVVGATVPSTAAPSEETDFTVTATSQSDPAATQTNTDTIDITTDGIIDLLKDQVLSVDADGDGKISLGDTIAVTLTYSNTGIGDATAVEITDDLPTTNVDGDPITLTYVSGSGEWSDNPDVALTEATGNVEATNTQGSSLSYETTGATTIAAQLDIVPAGRSGTITFEYVVTAAPQGTVENIARVESATQPETSSNPSPVTVDPSASLVLADALATAVTPSSGTDGANRDATEVSTSDNDGAQDDVITDTVPGFTTLEYCTADACEPALTINGAAGTVGIDPGDEGTGSVASSAQNAGFSLAPGSRAVLTFSVQIDS